jgi:nucleoside-triphosphatase THEP1
MIIVDEFGPLELNGKGWRSDVDNLLAGKHPPILLVVRSGLADEARKLYAGNVCMSLEANKPGSIDEMADFIGRYSRAGNRSASQ